MRPHRRQPTRLLCPWDSPGKNTGVGCHFLLQCMKVKSLSGVRLLATPWTAAYQDPPSMGFSRQEYWSGVPLPSPTESARWTQIMAGSHWCFCIIHFKKSSLICLENSFFSLEWKQNKIFLCDKLPLLLMAHKKWKLWRYHSKGYSSEQNHSLIKVDTKHLLFHRWHVTDF